MELIVSKQKKNHGQELVKFLSLSVLILIFLPLSVEAKVIRHNNFTFNLPSHWEVKNGPTGGVDAVIEPPGQSPDKGQLLVISEARSGLKKLGMTYFTKHLKRQFAKRKHPQSDIRFFQKGKFKGKKFSGHFAEYETLSAGSTRKVFTVMTSTKDKIYFFTFSAGKLHYKENLKKAVSIIKLLKLPSFSYSSGEKGLFKQPLISEITDFYFCARIN